MEAPFDASSREFTEHLRLCAQAGKETLAECAVFREELLRVLTHFERKLTAAHKRVADDAPEDVRKAVTQFGAQLSELRLRLKALATTAGDELRETYEDLERDSRFVTIMLFGRTRAGKSTTMEALTGGNGSTIGVGRQDTTREVKAYYFPERGADLAAAEPALRIVDTPGIEGFQGAALGQMAEAFVERADHVFFLLTEDKATSSELDHFGLIRTQGKGVTVLLNVKRNDEDLDLVATSPEVVFQPDQLDGHQRRISGYLTRNFGIESPPVIPYHARAGWLARRKAELPDGVMDRGLILRNSRLSAIERRLADFIRDESLPARVRAPHDVLRSHSVTLKDELRPFAGRFKGFMLELAGLLARTKKALVRAEAKARRRIPELRARYQLASDEVPGLVDELIAEGKSGKNLPKRWQLLLKSKRVPEGGQDFVEGARQDCVGELQEEARVAAFDSVHSSVDDVAREVDAYHEAEAATEKHKYIRAGTRAGVGLAVGGLTTWAIGNWWNPTGWAAAAAALVVGVVSYGGQHLAKIATDTWAAETKKDLFARRNELVKHLRELLWKDWARTQRNCADWLSKLLAVYRQSSAKTLDGVRVDAERLWHTTVQALDELDALSSRADRALLVRLCALAVPEIRSGDIEVCAVFREPGLYGKICVRGRGRFHRQALGPCIGKGGERIRRLQSMLGGERLAFVDMDASLPQRVVSALGPARLGERAVMIVGTGARPVAHLDVAAKELHLVLGHRGANVRLAELATQTKIYLPRSMK